ncbi:EAL domain-containing response regulator [Chitinibacter sp. SCUT-21]|uniref:EAL domain-containing response regulator n=1 Tax=Chitinibacter sp. SCUT-21 TaxID=2970891 RepID=UPI0035A69333
MPELSNNQPMRIMVVDDSKVQLQFAVDLCTAQGWSVVEMASDGLEALLKLKQLGDESLDLLLLDLEMPGLNGIDLLQELARLKLTLPICILSSRELGLLESVSQMGLQLGLNIIQAIQKPLQEQALKSLRFSPQVQINAAITSLSSEDFQAARGNLQTRYTPCVSLDTGLIHHLVARLVWIHPQLGMLSPRQYALEIQSDRLFLQTMQQHHEEVFAQIQSWKSSGSSMAVQLDLPWQSMSRALHARNLLNQIQDLGILETKLTFEIEMPLNDGEFTQHLSALNLLRIQNVGLAIRDCALEFDWVKQVRQVPFNHLVLACDALAQREHDSLLPILLENTVRLARQLNMNVHAEGLNTLQDWTFLRQMGCHSAQGALAGNLMRAEDVIPWMKENLASLRQLAEQAHSVPSSIAHH